MDNPPVAVHRDYHHTRYSSVLANCQQSCSMDQGTQSHSSRARVAVVLQHPGRIHGEPNDRHHAVKQLKGRMIRPGQENARILTINPANRRRAVPPYCLLAVRRVSRKHTQRRDRSFKGRMISNVGIGTGRHLRPAGEAETKKNQRIHHCSQE